MNDAENAVRIAVIGIGPRGLGALEALAEKITGDSPSLEVDVFDPFPAPGAGPNYDPEEDPLCLLNIPVRDISIRASGFSQCGRFTDWLDRTPEPDSYPARAELGRYLHARFNDLLDHGAFTINLRAQAVARAEPFAGRWRLLTGESWSAPYDEVLLTLGQPRSAPDDQWAEWQDHAARSNGQIAQAYPARDLATKAADWSGKVVAIRGMGLSAYDVLRELTIAQGGAFREGRYQASGREPARIIPFSLDGKPPFPKPETEEWDTLFEPDRDETRAFSEAIAQASVSETGTARRLITGALAPAVGRIMAQHGSPAGREAVADWLETEWTSPGSQETAGAFDILCKGIALAEGACAPTIGYAVGQVWRKWQNEIRAGYNPARTPADTAKMLTDFDEGLKRYSYGPPVASSREMAAFVGKGLVDLTFADDPDIELTANGWSLGSEGAHCDVSIMIDAVLPSPDLSTVTASLVSDLSAKGDLVQVAGGLAAKTDADGRVIGRDGAPRPGLCLLGRMALGSVIAVDSLHDCFGEASTRWAKGLLDRIG